MLNRNKLIALPAAPAAAIVQCSGQTIGTTTWTKSVINSIIYQKDITVNGASNLLVIEKDGLYQFNGITRWTNTSTAGVRAVGIEVNGAIIAYTDLLATNTGSGLFLAMGISLLIPLISGDQVAMDIWSNAASQSTVASGSMPNYSLYLVSET